MAAGRVLATAAPADQPPGEVLTVVIEGDGRAHDRAGRPTADPTPRDSQGLRIARAWPRGPVTWIARPCQHTRRLDAACRPEDWTTDRFAEPALDALDAAVDEAKAAAGATRIVLVGWSGGGVMAAALARRRDDVAGLVTFAAPLDVAAWTRRHQLSDLNLARDVAALAEAAPPTPQVHLYGARDRLVTPTRPGGPGVAVEIVDEGHACCWARRAAETLDRLHALTPAGR